MTDTSDPALLLGRYDEVRAYTGASPSHCRAAVGDIPPHGPAPERPIGLARTERDAMRSEEPDISLLPMDGLRTADIVDAMGRLHRHRCHILDLVSPTPDRILFGPAATISFAPSCQARLPVDRYNFAGAFDKAVGEDGRGKVLVLASNGYPDTSLGGGTKLSRLNHRGLAGLLADGRLRDFDQLARYGFTTRCRGETTRWGGDDVTPFEADRPVVFDRVLIMPGDLIYADSSGAVVIPAAESVAVVTLAREISAEEMNALEQIADEEGAHH